MRKKWERAKTPVCHEDLNTRKGPFQEMEKRASLYGRTEEANLEPQRGYPTPPPQKKTHKAQIEQMLVKTDNDNIQQPIEHLSIHAKCWNKEGQVNASLFSPVFSKKNIYVQLGNFEEHKEGTG